jgi:septum formation protein
VIEKVILASASPRRRELLQWIYEDFDIQAADIEEVVPDFLPLSEAPEYLACIKAQAVASEHPEALVIGSDTGVFVEEGGAVQMLGKPRNAEEAEEMLRRLSGRRHVVRTGCCLCYRNVKYAFTEEAQVEFYPLSEQEIKEYVATGDPMDKAGAYGIQGRGALLVKGIIGDFYTVMGLPVARLKREIERMES